MSDIICRICLIEKNDSPGEWWSVFEKISKKTVLQIMMDCANLKVLEDDPLPKVVCQKCFENIKIVSTLEDLIIASDVMLRKKYFKVKTRLENLSKLNSIIDMDSFKQHYAGLENNILNGDDSDTAKNLVDLSCNVNKPADIRDLKIEIKFEEIDSVKDIAENSKLNEENVADNKIGFNRSGSFNKPSNNIEQTRKKARKKSTSPTLYEMFMKVGEIEKSRKQNTEKTNKKFQEKNIEKQLETNFFNGESNEKQVSDDGKGDSSHEIKSKIDRSHMKKAKCPTCNHVSINKYVLRQHIRLKHEMEDDKKPYSCDMCPKRYINNYQLKVHQNSHTGAKPYPCDMCDRKFKSPTAARLHKQLQHIADKKWKCFECKKGFISQHMLQNHVRQAHTKERPFLCEMCSKGFAAKGMLTTHIKSVHNRETEPCPVCKKEYNIFSMKVHLQSHQGVKNHVCETCGNAFTTKGSLKAHTFIHTGEKPNVCQICGKGFIQKQSLKKHIMSHSDLRPFLCSLCNETYKYRQDLIRHMRKHQKE